MLICESFEHSKAFWHTHLLAGLEGDRLDRNILLVW